MRDEALRHAKTPEDKGAIMDAAAVSKAANLANEHKVLGKHPAIMPDEAIQMFKDTIDKIKEDECTTEKCKDDVTAAVSALITEMDETQANRREVVAVAGDCPLTGKLRDCLKTAKKNCDPKDDVCNARVDAKEKELESKRKEIIHSNEARAYSIAKNEEGFLMSFSNSRIRSSEPLKKERAVKFCNKTGNPDQCIKNVDEYFETRAIKTANKTDLGDLSAFVGGTLENPNMDSAALKENGKDAKKVPLEICAVLDGSRVEQCNKAVTDVIRFKSRSEILKAKALNHIDIVDQLDIIQKKRGEEVTPLEDVRARVIEGDGIFSSRIGIKGRGICRGYNICEEAACDRLKQLSKARKARGQLS